MNEYSKELEDRGPKYGPFSEMACTAQRLKDIMRSAPVGGMISRPPTSYAQCEALDLIATKIARILTGDPDYLDSWVDIQGYVQLAIDDIKRRKHLKEQPSDEPLGQRVIK